MRECWGHKQAMSPREAFAETFWHVLGTNKVERNVENICSDLKRELDLSPAPDWTVREMRLFSKMKLPTLAKGQYLNIDVSCFRFEL